MSETEESKTDKPLSNTGTETHGSGDEIIVNGHDDDTEGVNAASDQITAEAKPETEESKGTSSKTEEPEVVDVLGNGKLLKKILKPGKGRETRPQMGSQVTVTFSAHLFDGGVVETQDTLTFVIGDGDYLQAFDLCCPLMELDETARVTTDATYAYGEIGRKPDIPVNARLVYDIHLDAVHGPMIYSNLSIADRLMEADKKRERGNFHYSRNEFSGAINSYSKALKVLDDQGETHSEEPSELQKLVDMRLKCYNNLAAAQLKIEVYEAAVKSCDSVLSIQPQNVKALFRKGKCLSAQGELKEAIACMKRALKSEPESKIIHSELSRLTSRQKVREERERAMYQRMMGQNGKPEKKEADSWPGWAWAAAAAGCAVAVSVGLAAYRYFHS